MTIKEINNKLINISRCLGDPNINPINSHAEKRKFISAYNKGDIYNPQFKYCSRSINFQELIKKAESIKTKHPILLPVRDHIIKKIKFTSKIGTNGFFFTGLYGKPKKRMVDKAKKTILRKKSKKHERPFSAKGAKEELKACFKKYDLNDWDVYVSNNLVAKADTSENNKILRIKRRNYSLDEIKRLEVHEIETHILRSVNGLKQKISLLGVIGTPNYLPT